MPTDEERLVQELKDLRIDRGMLSADLDKRKIPLLRERSGATESSGDELRDKLTRFLNDVIIEVPEPEQHLVRSTLNLDGDHGDRKLTERMDDLGNAFRHDRKTVRRKSDDGLRTMAKAIVRGSWARDGDGHSGSGWYIDHLDVVLRLDTYPVQSIERRSIVSTVSGLEKVANSVTFIPADDREPTLSSPPLVEVIFGAVSEPTGVISGGNLTSDILLPKALARGERHTYGIVVSGPPTAPHFVCAPTRRHNNFTLTIRFDQKRLPRRAWVLDGALYRAIDQATPTSDLRIPDRAGEVRQRFGKLERGLVYGIQWQW